MSEVSFESKKLAPLRILEVLEKYSDENHILTQAEIAEKLDRENNTDCAFVGCLGDYEMNNTALVFRGPWSTIKALENLHFVRYWA